MISIVPYQPLHGASIVMQSRQMLERPNGGYAVADLGPAYTALRDGQVLLCAGLAINHPGHATAWAWVADGKGHGLVAITRAIQRVLGEARYPRIDTLVRGDFEEAHVWAMLLGFAREAVLHRWGRDGADYHLYLYQRKAG